MLVCEQVKKFPVFLEPEVSTLFSQEPATGNYPEPAESSPRSNTLFL
jgi:hypothetical protein